MGTKQSGIKLGYGLMPDPKNVGQVRNLWRVEQVTDSTDFNPGDVLEKNTVDLLCRNKGWKVVINPLK